MQQILLFIFALVVTQDCSAADARKYAALSLIGDQMELTVARMQTGSNVPANSREIVSFPDPAFDRFVLRTVDRIVANEQRGAGVVMLATRDPRLYALQERILDKNSGVDELVSGLRNTMTKQQATHLILVTRYRHEALLPVENGGIGGGILEGIGFYIDHTRPLKNAKSLERSVGFLAPYAYFKVSIVDLTTMQIIRAETAIASVVHAGSQAQGVIHPWDTMEDRTKIQVLQSLLRNELQRVLPALIQG